jgi:hypothetical protein
MGKIAVCLQFPSEEDSMRRTILILTLAFCAPTAAMALTAGRTLVGNSEAAAAGAAIQQGQIAAGGIAGSADGEFLGGNVILAKGDQSGTGPGAGGHKGAKKGEGKGGQPESKAAKAKGGQPSGQPGGQPRGEPAQPRR